VRSAFLLEAFELLEVQFYCFVYSFIEHLFLPVEQILKNGSLLLPIFNVWIRNLNAAESFDNDVEAIALVPVFKYVLKLFEFLELHDVYEFFEVTRFDVFSFLEKLYFRDHFLQLVALGVSPFGAGQLKNMFQPVESYFVALVLNLLYVY